MNESTIEHRCSFKTARHSVESWKNLVNNEQSKNHFAEKVIGILTPNVTKALPEGWQHINTLEKAKGWIAERANESHFLTIRLLSTNETIGFLFLYESDPEHSYHDLRFGYLLSEKVWGKGLGTELVEGLIDWCKASGDIKSLSGGVEPGNAGSIRVLEKAGFSISTMDTPTDQVRFYEYKFDLEDQFDEC